MDTAPVGRGDLERVRGRDLRDSPVDPGGHRDGPATAGATVLVARMAPSWPIAAPFLILWMLSPAVARWASLPRGFAGAKAISDDDARTLRLIARRTWRFFETFVTVDHHALPPDNFQEDPTPVVAHRTSPTNIGLYLLSIVAAHDFGWLGTIETVDRLEATLATMNRLERFHGHFYNWYDTHDLRPLEPKFVSAVDSGNLAGHLLALGMACREMEAAPALAEERSVASKTGWP
jgi:cyclic beta-1,2-glucan synthetase